MAADYGIIVADFLHSCFDKDDHDVARSVPEYIMFSDTIQELFMDEQGGLLAREAGLTAPGPQAPARSLPGGTTGAFITEIACKEVVKQCVFEAGDHQVFPWGDIRPDEARELRHRMRTVSSAMLDRVRVEVTAVELRQAF